MIAEDKKNKPVSGFLVVPKIERTIKFVKSMSGGEEQQCFQAPDGKTWYSVTLKEKEDCGLCRCGRSA